jgi:Ni/Fe-hydrogenase subunit HybB-like protein
MEARTLTLLKDSLWAIVFAGLAAAIVRFSVGLGAATGMNDVAPWGLWIAMKLCFVAIAGGGFTLAAMVYIFHLEYFRPILRRAILLATLGYGSFIVSLLFDLGLPWHIYMPVFNWQHHSVMFEIAWCVMLYFSVLMLEISPVILEHPVFRHPLFQKILKALHSITLPLVIAGIVLSTLHQSSLGSLFLIMPHRVHPLWYSPLIPVLFFTSAIAAGIMALVLEGFLAERWFGSPLRIELLSSLTKIGGIALAIYLALRVGDLFARGVLPTGLDGSWQSILFSLEILIGGGLPLILLGIQKVRNNREGLLTIALLVLAGIISQRMSLSMFTMWRPPGTSYIPTLSELAIAFGIPSMAVLVYLFVAEHFAVLQEEIPEKTVDILKHPFFDHVTQANQEIGWRGIIARRSGLAIVVVALMLASFPVGSFARNEVSSKPVQPALGWEMLLIDGNASGYKVNFPHMEHQERFETTQETSQAACQVCHHLNRPDDDSTACWFCHRDYNQSSSIFDHTAHQQALGANTSCGECHVEEHTSLSVKSTCGDCHETMTSSIGETEFNYLAPSYQEAMHGLCLECHRREAVDQERPELAQCSFCHSNNEKNTNIQALVPGP